MHQAKGSLFKKQQLIRGLKALRSWVVELRGSKDYWKFFLNTFKVSKQMKYNCRHYA